jgi:hypothetical protein
MKIKIITSCTGEKALSMENQLTKADFQAGRATIARQEQEHAQHLLPAGEMYTGQQHQRLMARRDTAW